eukprot:4702689-Prymnesium_polylepis.2
MRAPRGDVDAVGHPRGAVAQAAEPAGAELDAAARAAPLARASLPLPPLWRPRPLRVRAAAQRPAAAPRARAARRPLWLRALALAAAAATQHGRLRLHARRPAALLAPRRPRRLRLHPRRPDRVLWPPRPPVGRASRAAVREATAGRGVRGREAREGAASRGVRRERGEGLPLSERRASTSWGSGCREGGQMGVVSRSGPLVWEAGNGRGCRA